MKSIHLLKKHVSLGHNLKHKLKIDLSPLKRFTLIFNLKFLFKNFKLKIDNSIN